LAKSRNFGSLRYKTNIFNIFTKIAPTRSGGAREGASGDTHPGAQALGAHQHTFCCHLKTCFKQKFRPKYASKRVFLGKKL